MQGNLLNRVVHTLQLHELEGMAETVATEWLDARAERYQREQEAEDNSPPVRDLVI